MIEIKQTPPEVGGSALGAVLSDGTVPLTGVWDTGDHNILGPSAIYTSSTAPSAPYTNMLWNDTSISTRIMIRRWSGSAWQVVYGYETAPRTVSLVHDHGALLTSQDILVALSEIGLFGAQDITVSIHNSTYLSLRSGNVVDVGSGKVKLPVPVNHGFLPGEIVCVDSTLHYNNIFTIDSVESEYVVVPSTYVAESVTTNGKIRVAINSPGLSIPGSFNNVIIVGDGAASDKNAVQPVVMYSPSSASPMSISGMRYKANVSGIRFLSPLLHGLVLSNCEFINVEYCSFCRIYGAGILSSYYSTARVAKCLFQSVGYGALVAYSASITSNNNSSVSDVAYGLIADCGGTVKKVSSTQPAGTYANEYAITSNAGQII